MVINLRVHSMKSEPPGSGRQPIESGPVPGTRDMSLTNGDRNASDVVLRQVSFYHDHISCTKAADLLEPMPCETDHLYAHCGDEVPEDTEQDRLRAVIVIHTDLIQHQQELIAERDRQIDELRAQRDALQDLLQQRRLQSFTLSVGCQTDSVEPPRLQIASEPAPREEPRAERVLREERRSEAPALEPRAPRSEQPRPEEPRPEPHRRQLFPEPSLPSEPPSSPQQAGSESAAQPEPSPPHEPEPPPRRPLAAEEEPEEEQPAELGAHEAPAEAPAAPVQSSCQEEPTRTPGARKRSVAARDEPNGRLLLTNRPYACLPCPEVQEAAEAIEVPTWRVNPVASAYSMEGTENLDDDVYNRRHHKLEVDERRRKRWDMQAMREQKRLERLRRRMEPEAEKPPSCPRTFCGSLRNVQVIEVVESLPVVAFGQPIPDVEPADFSLPWFNPWRHGERSGEDHLAAKYRKRSSLGGRSWR